MNRLFKLTLFITFLYWSHKSLAQEKDDYTGRIDSLIGMTTPRPFNGVILITRDGKTKYAKAKGYSNFSQKIPLKLDDPFVILSNSKQITAVLILQQVEKGRVDLLAPIRMYLPHLEQSWADTITVHQLLNHTSRIVDVDKPLVFKAGTSFKYSDLNYVLLGKIIESTTGKTYQATANAFFKKCGMNSSFVPDAGDEQKLINGYQYLVDHTVREIKGIVIPKERIPAAGIVTTAQDLALWNKLLHGGRLLKKSTYAAMISYAIKAQHPVFGNDKIGYGYGIRINDTERIKEYGHTGIVPNQGFTSVTLYYPATKTSVVVLENQAFDDFEISYHFEKAIRHIVIQSSLTKTSYP